MGPLAYFLIFQYFTIYMHDHDGDLKFNIFFLFTETSICKVCYCHQEIQRKPSFFPFIFKDVIIRFILVINDHENSLHL